MKLLLDANLSWRLIAELENHFDQIKHVDQLGLSIPVPDHVIWEFAGAGNFIIVTNDQDFLDMISVKGFPPKVVAKNRKPEQFIFKANDNSTQSRHHIFI